MNATRKVERQTIHDALLSIELDLSLISEQSAEYYDDTRNDFMARTENDFLRMAFERLYRHLRSEADYFKGIYRTDKAERALALADLMWRARQLLMSNRREVSQPEEQDDNGD